MKRADAVAIAERILLVSIPQVAVGETHLSHKRARRDENRNGRVPNHLVTVFPRQRGVGRYPFFRVKRETMGRAFRNQLDQSLDPIRLTRHLSDLRKSNCVAFRHDKISLILVVEDLRGKTCGTTTGRDSRYRERADREEGEGKTIFHRYTVPSSTKARMGTAGACLTRGSGWMRVPRSIAGVKSRARNPERKKI